MRSIVYLCVVLAFNISRNAVYSSTELVAAGNKTEAKNVTQEGIPSDWEKTCKNESRLKDCDDILKRACRIRPKTCPGMIAKVPLSPLDKMCSSYCDVKENGNVTTRRPDLCNICLHKRGVSCSKTYPTLQLCWSDDVEHKCKVLFEHCKAEKKTYCKAMRRNMRFCENLKTADTYTAAYELYCHNGNGTRDTQRCAAIIDSLHTRELHIVYPICMKLCERQHEVCIECIEQYRDAPSNWTNTNETLSEQMIAKFCKENVKNEDICPKQTETTEDNPSSPNMRVVYIVGTVVAALIIIIFGVIIYLFFEMRQRRRLNKNKHNKSETGVSSAVSGASSTMSEDNSATRIRTLASQATVSQLASDSHMSAKDRTRKGKKQTKKRESQVGMGDDSRTGSRETEREGYSKKLESQLGNTTFNVSNTNIDYEITKGEGKRARAKPSTTKGRDTEIGGDTKIWEADKTTKKEGATEVDYELTMGEGKQPKKPNVRRKATETETGNETERVSEMK